MPHNNATFRTKSRRILMACPWGPVGGGMYRVADYLIRHQAEDAAGSVRLEGLDTRGQGSAAGSLLVLARALAELVKGRLRGDIAGVHVHMAERLSVLRKSLVLITCRLLGLPVILHLHAAQLHHFYRALPAPGRWFTRWTFSLAPSVVVLGEASRRFVTQTLEVPAERVSVLVNGVPEPRQPRRTHGDVRQVLFVGNLSERKGVSDLLRALGQPGFDAQHTRVTLAGGGDVAHYRRLAQELGLASWVRFEGWVDQARVAELMAQADVLVLPSYDEGLPLVILEALAQGLAVLCTPVGEIGNVLQDGQEALFVPPGNVDGLAQRLQALLRDASLRQRLGLAGRRLYAARFSMPRFFEEVAALHLQHFGCCARWAAEEVAGDTTAPAGGKPDPGASPAATAPPRPLAEPAAAPEMSP